MFKEKACGSIDSVVKYGHGFGPLSKVVDENYYAFVAILKWWIASHEIVPHLKKGPMAMKRCRGFVGMSLTTFTLFYHLNIVMEKSGSEVVGMEDLLGSGNP